MIVRITAEKFCETDEQATAFEAAVVAVAPDTDRRMVRTDEMLIGTAKKAYDEAFMSVAKGTVRQEVIGTVTEAVWTQMVEDVTKAVDASMELDQKAKDVVKALIANAKTVEKVEP